MKPNKLITILITSLLLLTACRSDTSAKSIYNAVRDDFANKVDSVTISDSILHVTFQAEDKDVVETMDVYPSEDLDYFYQSDDMAFSIELKDKELRILVLNGTDGFHDYKCSLSEGDCPEEADDYISFLTKRLSQYKYDLGE